MKMISVKTRCIIILYITHYVTIFYIYNAWYTCARAKKN